MDRRSFDAVAKTLAGPDRRRALRLLAGALLGGAFALPGEDAAAACRRNRDCRGRQVCRNRTCMRRCADPFTCADPTNGVCPPGCFCGREAGGGGLCVDGDCPTVGCGGHADCPRGQVCVTGCCGGFPEFVCLPKCA